MGRDIIIMFLEQSQTVTMWSLYLFLSFYLLISCFNWRYPYLYLEYIRIYASEFMMIRASVIGNIPSLVDRQSI